MAEDVVSLSFISRLGLRNVRNAVLVESIKASLQGMNTQLDDTGVADTGEQTESRVVEESRSRHEAVKETIRKEVPLVGGSSDGHTTASEVEILTHIIGADKEESEHQQDGVSDAMQIRTIELTLVMRDLVIKARDETAWCTTPLDDGQQDEERKIPWEGMPRLIALLVVAMAVEKRAATQNSLVIPVMVNHLRRSFRYSFQSAGSDLCVLDRPEWAITYIGDAIRSHQALFKRVRREVSTLPELLFAALIPDHSAMESDDHRQCLQKYFEKLCSEFAQGEFFKQWTISLVKETRWFVYSRLPLLVYDYRTRTPDARLTIYEVANITANSDIETRIKVMRSFYDDEVKANLMYNILRAMTELAATIRATDHNAVFELFGDLDKNTPIPCITLKVDDETRELRLELDYEHDVVYGALDALISLEKTVTTNIMKTLVGEETIMDNIRCNNAMQTNWYLQDGAYITQPMKILITLLEMFDERCKCLETIKSKNEFTTQVIVPLITSYLEFIKAKWNAEDDVFRSCSLTAFLIDSTSMLHEFLLKYPYTSYMPQVLASVEKVVQRMMLIMGDYMSDIMEEPFNNIHERRLDVVTYIKEKMLQMAVLCSLKTYKQMVKAAIEKVEKRLLAVLIPPQVQQIILNRQTHLDVVLQNCNLIYDEIKELTDSTYCPEAMQIIEDVKTLLETHPEDLITAIETLNTSIRIDSIFKESNEMVNARPGSREHQSVVNRKSSLSLKRISIQSGSADVDQTPVAIGYTLDLEDVSESDDDTMTEEANERESLKKEAVGEQMIIDKVKQRVKVQKLNVQQMYTLTLHILYATLEPWQFKELLQ